MSQCLEVLEAFHKLVHQVLELKHLCAGSGSIDLEDTDPETTLVVIIAAVETCDVKRIQLAGHTAITDIMTEIYGASNEMRKQ